MIPTESLCWSRPSLQPLEHAVSNRHAVFLCCLLTVPAIAQQPEDPEDNKRTGLRLDQTISAGLSPNRSLELEIHKNVR